MFRRGPPKTKSLISLIFESLVPKMDVASRRPRNLRKKKISARQRRRLGMARVVLLILYLLPGETGRFSDISKRNNDYSDSTDYRRW